MLYLSPHKHFSLQTCVFTQRRLQRMIGQIQNSRGTQSRVIYITVYHSSSYARLCSAHSVTCLVSNFFFHVYYSLCHGRWECVLNGEPQPGQLPTTTPRSKKRLAPHRYEMECRETIFTSDYLPILSVFLLAGERQGRGLARAAR